MAGMKAVTNASVLNSKLQLNHFEWQPLRFSHFIQEKKVFPLSRSGTKHGLRKKQVKKQTLAMAVFHIEDTTMKLAMTQEATSKSIVKLTALINVRHHKAHAKEMMNNLLNIFKLASPSKGVLFQLVSTQLDPGSMGPKLSKETILEWSTDLRFGAEGGAYKVEFVVDSDFGSPGAITVINNSDNEFFLESITIEEHAHFACKSWVQPNALDPEKRIFFTNKPYLPCETPIGLKELREKELRQLRGDGRGQRTCSDRIYDYDVYNDLGDPDKGDEYARPTLSGQRNPHPRRCRTGRPPTTNDMKAESQLSSESVSIYVPRDEELDDIKRETVDQGKLKGILKNIVPSFIDTIMGIDEISYIDKLFKEAGHQDMASQTGGILTQLPLPMILSNLRILLEDVLKFDPPKIISRKKSFFLQDDEFGRQMLAGLNPMSIERLKDFPPVSKLNPSIYGPLESALKEEHIKDHIDGMSVQQALEENKLFILDYHDAYLPFLEGINALEGRKTYATRTIFFLTQMEILKPIAIELTLPSKDPCTPSKQVLTPSIDGITNWLWQLAKAHVCSNDAGVHQLVHHWLRVHACMEPFIIATHRQLSVMHPIFKLLHPHMRYTMKINATARETLISAGGVIESNYTAGKYCMQISCAAYKNWWRFDLEGLPADLIRRGVAVPDATQPHCLRLLIEDYPYASDGLLIWSSIRKLVKTYVNYYYKDADAISSDDELQAWYKETINLGHADLQNASWWPKLATPDDLISILTNIIWTISAEHAVLNFGQYPNGGYVPNRPPLMRRLIPKEEDADYTDFVTDPKTYFLSSLPSLFQATKFMASIEIGSTHSPDEEYIGDLRDMSSWLEDPEIIDAFHQFSIEMKNIEKEIERRNADPKLRSRCGAGVSSYELLIPTSGPGATGRGVPKSATV